MPRRPPARPPSSTRLRFAPTGEDPEAPDPVGAVEAKVRADVAAIMTAHPMGEGLAEMAYTLARTLDAGAGLAVAAVSRELRATLTDLAGMVADGDDDLETQLSAPVRDAEDPGEGDAGSGG